MKYILGSQSKSRRLLFARLVPEFETMAADLDEKAIRCDDHMLLSLLLARAKSDALLPHVPSDAILVTSDQVVVCGEELREKPESPEEARRFLRSYAAGLPAQTNTAIVVHNKATGKRVEGVDVARVYYRPVPSQIIDQLIAVGDIFSAAGGFRIEDPLVEPYLERIEGEKESIMGLPLVLTRRLLDEAATGGKND